MVNEMQELDDFEDVEYREYQKKEPCSVSGYGDLQSKSAHDALLQASRDLLPLADYIEQNYSPDPNKDSNQVLNGCEGFTLQGGKTLLEGGEYMIKAVSAVAYNVALLAQSFNEKLISLDEEVKKITHDVETAGSKIKIYQHRMSLNKVKKITVKNTSISLESPGPITRNGEFIASTKYSRKRIDFNMFDEIGHGHRIHAASFGMIDGMERQKSVDFKDLPDPDGDSNEGLPIAKQVGRRASIITSTMKRGSTYVGGVRGNDKRVTQAPMSFPTAPSAFPKSPKGSAFPSVPESPTLSASSSVVSEGSQGFEVGKKDSSGSYTQGRSSIDTWSSREKSVGNEIDISEERMSSLQLLLPSLPPHLPPPDLPSLSPDLALDMEPFDNSQNESARSSYSRMSMLPAPDFDNI